MSVPFFCWASQAAAAAIAFGSMSLVSGCGIGVGVRARQARRPRGPARILHARRAFWGSAQTGGGGGWPAALVAALSAARRRRTPRIQTKGVTAGAPGSAAHEMNPRPLRLGCAPPDFFGAQPAANVQG